VKTIPIANNCGSTQNFTQMDRQTCKSQKFRIIRGREGEKYPESKSALEPKQELPHLFTSLAVATSIAIA